MLFVGKHTGYKRFDIAIDILAEIPELSLKIIGGGLITQAEKQIFDKNLSGRYEWLDLLPNGALCNLYNESFCLLYTTNYEGFGVLVLEAQSCGCPVVCQPVSSIPEVAGDAGIYFNPGDMAGRIAQIKKLFDPAYYAKISLRH